MYKIDLDIACGIYDRTQLLENGKIKPRGINLIWLEVPPWELFYRMLRNLEFRISEMSMSNYLTESCSPNPRFIAIPIFLNRYFRHSCVFVNSKSGIRKPADLQGRRVGVPEYSMSAAVWVRGILKDDYDINATDIKWFTGGLNATTKEEGRDRIDISYPKELSITRIPDDCTLNDMLLAGKLDAAITAGSPKSFIAGDKRIERLFPNYRELEADYYQRTKIYPIMHTVVIRKDVYEQHPWTARSLYDAFLEAKDIACARFFETSTPVCGIPWLINEAEKAKALFGEDIWPYGVKANKKVLETFLRYARQQHVISQDLTVDKLFAKETLRT